MGNEPREHYIDDLPSEGEYGESLLIEDPVLQKQCVQIITKSPLLDEKTGQLKEPLPPGAAIAILDSVFTRVDYEGKKYISVKGEKGLLHIPDAITIEHSLGPLGTKPAHVPFKDCLLLVIVRTPGVRPFYIDKKGTVFTGK